MSVLQYVGARYVPVFYKNPNGTWDWEEGVAYEPMTIVKFGENSYTSRSIVPATIGSPNLNPDYWANTGNYNGFIAELNENVQSLLVDKGKVINPFSFGAKGDGVTDDTLALSIAIRSMVDGSVLDLRGGRFLVSSTIKMPITVDSIIMNGVIIAAESFTGNHLLEGPGTSPTPTRPGTNIVVCDNVTLSHITLLCNGKCGGLLVSGFLKLRVDSCFFYDYTGYGFMNSALAESHEMIMDKCFFFTQHSANAIIEESHDDLFSNIVIRGDGTEDSNGIYFREGSGWSLIENIHTYGCKYGLYAENGALYNPVVNFYFDGGGIYIASPYNFHISNAYFLNLKTPALTIGRGQFLENVHMDGVIRGVQAGRPNNNVIEIQDYSSFGVGKRNFISLSFNDNVLTDNTFIFAPCNDNSYPNAFNTDKWMEVNSALNTIFGSSVDILSNGKLVNNRFYLESLGTNRYPIFPIVLEKNSTYMIFNRFGDRINNIWALASESEPTEANARCVLLTSNYTYGTTLTFNTGEHNYYWVACSVSNNLVCKKVR